jgi:Arc/MetJ-type ribon-helix-helix transcriptional regulator
MATTLNVRITGPLEDFVSENIGANGSSENASEYVRDLIRRDRERVEAERFATLQAELQRAFAAPESEYKPFDPDAFLRRARDRWRG